MKKNIKKMVKKMEFEEEIYQAVRRKEEVLKRRFIRKYGNLNQMRPYTRAVYEKKHGNTTKSTIRITISIVEST